MRVLIQCIVVAVGLSLGGCSEQGAHTRGVYMLLDTSGTYTQELIKAQHIINFTLAKLDPGDSFAVARIDTGSFSEKDIVAKAHFDSQPTKSNQQKRQFSQVIDTFVKEVTASPYTDITGGLLQAIEFLEERNPGRKTVLIFSDLKEELQAGYVRDIPLSLTGVDVVALNVTKLRSDNRDPREYMERMAQWKKKVESGGGHWRVVNDLDRLDGVLGGT